MQFVAFVSVNLHKHAPMPFFPKCFRLRDPGPSELDLQTWLAHIKAGEAFNNAVMKARISSYFSDDIDEIDPKPIDDYLTEGSEFNYLVPGRVPEGDAEKAVYMAMLNRSDSRRKEQEHVLEQLTLLVLAIRNRMIK